MASEPQATQSPSVIDPEGNPTPMSPILDAASSYRRLSLLSATSKSELATFSPRYVAILSISRLPFEIDDFLSLHRIHARYVPLPVSCFW